MSVWRAFIFSLCIAFFAAISLPARALENVPPALTHSAYVLTDLYNDTGNTDFAKNDFYNSQLTPALLSDVVLSEPKNALSKLFDNHSDDEESANGLPIKTPAYQIGVNHNASFPPFERQAASAFGTVVQNEPIFVLVYEFLPETLGLKHFLAPLITNNTVPWYLRPDVANGHSRLAGWKDGNTLYTGAITYLS